MDKNYSRKSANATLLSKKERDYLTKSGIKYDRRDKSEFLKNLTLRYQNLVEDLRIIQNDEKGKKILDNWKLKNSLEFQYYFTQNIFWKSFGIWQQVPNKIYPSKLHREIKGKKKISYYWIEPRKIVNLSFNEISKALSPEYLFTKIKRIKIDDQEKIDLIKGYEEGVIPVIKKDSIPRKEIKRRIDEIYSPKTKEGKKILGKKFEQDPRNAKINEITNSKKFLKLERKMNELLEPCGSKITQILVKSYATSSNKENHYNE